MALALGGRPRLLNSEDVSNGAFEAQSRGFGNGCLRFMPAFPLTIQYYILVGCQPLLGRSYTHRIPLKSFRLHDHRFLLLGVVAQSELSRKGRGPSTVDLIACSTVFIGATYDDLFVVPD